MRKIQTRNAIAESGVELLRRAGYEVGPDVDAPEALLIRSAKLHDEVFNDELLCIGRAGIGVDNIPLDRCTEAGIAVFNTPGANADSVKELLMCALVLASRDIIGSIEWVKSLAGEGDKIPALVEKGKNAFVGPEISGKRLGIIGLGGIGSKVANAALRLDMEVSGYDPFLSVDSAWNLSSKVEHVTDLDVLYRTCDYLIIQVHSTPETYHYLNAEAFAKMKPGMRVLNFARGELVDDDALLAALESGQVARYLTDFPNQKLVGVKNVVAMPHIGACTPEAEEKCALMAAREIRDYLENGNISNSVNLPAAVLDRLGASRLCLLHENKPGMLNAFLEIIAGGGFNVEHMLNKARGGLAYTIFDTEPALDESVAERMRAIPGVKRVRLLH
jgi:Phosphoglycerate dehydrogenase and related dehydrogenases